MSIVAEVTRSFFAPDQSWGRDPAQALLACWRTPPLDARDPHSAFRSRGFMAGRSETSRETKTEM